MNSSVVSKKLRPYQIFSLTRNININNFKQKIFFAHRARLDLKSINTGDPRLKKEIARAWRVVGRNIPILIQGVSGTGKGVFARAFHNSGPRSVRPFIELDCASLSNEFLEPELFGRLSRGSGREGFYDNGIINSALGGTIYFKNVNNMPLALQSRLCRLIDGCSETYNTSWSEISYDISLVFSTNSILKDCYLRGEIREDLYYRICSLVINLSPLRERTDIRQLANYILEFLGARGEQLSFSEDALKAIEENDWPNNISELLGAICTAISMLRNGEKVINNI
ncbi:sigma 54-interacting transcriptional regulator [Dechloromonas sp.]|uniref:sigma 54-interacting transcriptional regulator n=1 Tax=Dechloromonas sp. TaxID=1917218 RepID=UPI00286E66D6|nr:sigma 54-interacting transcriptional regulator [Dechloromonas sp.]